MSNSRSFVQIIAQVNLQIGTGNINCHLKGNKHISMCCTEIILGSIRGIHWKPFDQMWKRWIKTKRFVFKDCEKCYWMAISNEYIFCVIA